MVNSFLDRMDNTKNLDEALVPFLEEHGFRVYPFGQTTVLAGSPMLASLKRLLVRDYSIADFGAGFMLKFAPDFVCVPGKGDPFFLDTKASVIPIFFDAYLASLREAAIKAGCKSLTRGDVGEVEREAWDVYNQFFPPDRTAICFGAPYNPRLLAMEWCSQVKSFYRFKANRNLEAGGSGTPHVNIHLGLMRTPDRFLADEFGTRVDPEAYQALVDVVKAWPIQKPKGRVNWLQFANAIKRMQAECPWIQARMPDEERDRHFGEKPLFRKDD